MKNIEEIEKLGKELGSELFQGIKKVLNKLENEIPPIIQLPKELTDKEIYDICLSYDHSFGLDNADGLFPRYTNGEREVLKSQVKELYRLISRTLIENHKLLKR